jgi:hypothetical protein
VKIIYLDQLHWIEIAKYINGVDSKSGTEDVLAYMKELSASEKAVFPLSISHYYETLKHLDSARRQRLAAVMSLLSKGLTISGPEKIVMHEVRSSLAKVIQVDYSDEDFNYLGKGLEHALGNSLGWNFKWPKSEIVPKEKKRKFENDFWSVLEKSFLSGVLKIGDNEYPFQNKNDFTADDKFKEHLQEWKGCAASMSKKELQKKIYSITFTDIYEPIREAIEYFEVAPEKLGELGEEDVFALLDAMPTRKVDMHLREQWAKNGDLPPKQSDLNDWVHVGAAVCYSDFVITENQMCSLLSRSTEYRSKVSSKLTDIFNYKIA